MIINDISFKIGDAIYLRLAGFLQYSSSTTSSSSRILTTRNVDGQTYRRSHLFNRDSEESQFSTGAT